VTPADALAHPEVYRGHWAAEYHSIGKLVGGAGAQNQGVGVTASLKVFSMGRMPDVPARFLGNGLEIDPESGAYNFILLAQDIRGTVEKRLKELKLDSIDVYLLLGVTKPAHMPPRIFDELRRVREEGKVKAIGLSTHDRQFAGRLAAEGAVDVLMIRYNAAHRGS
jgi:hypothetical protein